MKIRTGFVSNSSSSSFIVEYRTSGLFSPDGEDKIVLTKEQLKKLKKYGFQFTFQNLEYILATHGEHIYNPLEYILIYGDSLKEIGERPATEEDYYHLGYFVICNEDEVAEFLIKNKISFKGLLTYGHEAILYDADKDQVVLASNFGSEVAMYGFERSEYCFKRKKYVVGTREEYLKGKLHLWKELDSDED